MHRPLLIALALCAASPTLLANPAERTPACCDITTLRQRGEQAAAVVYGTLEHAPDDAETVTLRIDRVLKGEADHAGLKSLPLPSRAARTSDPKNPQKQVVFCELADGKPVPCYGVPVASAGFLEYVRKVLALKAGDRTAALKFFFEALDHDHPGIASDAFTEFVYADYEDVRKVAAAFPADRIVGWLQDPRTPSWQYGVFSLLLGHCGKPEHAAVIRKALDDPRFQNVTIVDGALNGYTLLAPEQGWAYIRAVLTGPRDPAPRGGVPGAADGNGEDGGFCRRYAALKSAKFLHQHWPDRVGRAKLITGVALALDQPDIVDLVIDFLREVQAADQVERVLALVEQPGSVSPMARRALARFALAFRTHPKAAAFLARQDAEWTRWIEEAEREKAFEKKLP